MSNPQLMQAFDFTPDELSANRAGQLSPRQKEMLEQTDIQQTLDIGCAFMVFIGVGLLLLLACVLLFNVGALVQSLINILPVIGVVAAGFIIAAIVFQIRGQMDRRGRPDVEALEGTITLREEEGGFNARYFLMIDDMTFRIRPEMYDTLKEHPPDDLFRVYYAYRFDLIMSIEAESDYILSG